MTHSTGAILLAAGLSRRAGAVNKLTARLEGIPLVRRSVMTLVSVGVEPVIVVSGHQSGKIEQALAGISVSIHYNPDFSKGMATSLATGIKALPASTRAVLIALGDMPHVKPSTCEALIGSYTPEKGKDICVPTYQGKPGNPVLFGRRFFKDLSVLTGDVGGKSVILANSDYVQDVPVNDPGIQMDYDTAQGLE